jgi:hypothetical protein
MKTGLTIEQMTDEVMRQSALKADYIVDTRRLELEHGGMGTVLRMTDDNAVDVVEPMDLNATAHRQIGTHCGIPTKYYDRMQTENPELLTTNVNSWFRRKPSQRLLRTLNGTARAFLSSRYRRIDNLEIMQAVLPIICEIPEVRFESCQITEDKMFIKAVNPRLQTEVTPGDIVQAGIVISNSETGQGRVYVQPLIYRLVCRNGMVVNDAGAHRNHIGRTNTSDENYLLYTDKTLQADDRAFLFKIQDTVRAAIDKAVFGRVVNMLRDAKDAHMETTDIPAIVKLASREFGLLDNEGEGVLKRLIEARDYTMYGLANAVTRHSQDVEDYERASNLEGVGYEIISMAPTLWNRLNHAAVSAAA